MSLDKSFEVEQSASIWRDSFLAFQSSLAYDKNQDQKDRHIKMKPISLYVSNGSLYKNNPKIN